MSQQKNFEKTALLALPKVAESSTPEKGLLTWSRPFLIEQVRERGVDVNVIRGITALDPENGLANNVIRPEYKGDNDVAIEHIGEKALDAFAAMRTIVKAVEVDHLVPVLNPTALRTHARNKDKTAEDLLRPAGAYDRHSALINPGGDIEKIDTLSGDLFVAKPNIGRLSQGVKVGDRSAIEAYLQGQEAPFLVEEKIDFSAALPSVKGIDEDQQQRLNEANKLGVNKELRMYYFGDGVWDSVMRVAKPGETDFRSDDWLYIDLDTIPDEVYQKSARVIDQIKERISTDEVNIALDFVYGSTASQSDPHWEVMEMNVAEPQLVREHEHMAIARRQHTKLATQIARIAVS